ncbi:dirigent protein 25 [Malania oleifera]|uniref:dirigent protein 25 n=1 Tax=Malania oleifera TaxID=397392 RepID=UPI0025AE20CF|nr:dirigent protein 25 [Malania oleifera]
MRNSKSVLCNFCHFAATMKRFCMKALLPVGSLMFFHDSWQTPKSASVPPVTILYLLLVAAASAQILDEDQPPVPAVTPNDPDSAKTSVSSDTPVATAPQGAPATYADTHHALSFFMHDIQGGSNPSARPVTEIISNSAVNGQVPFAKPSGAVLPFNNGIPLNNGNNNELMTNNNPFLTGLGGGTSNVIQNNGNNLMNGVPVINSAHIPGGTTIQKLMFGTMTVIDDELTEGHELGSRLVGKAQGFYVASSMDGSCHTMAFTAMFQSGNYVNSLNFFGVHQMGISESQLAVMGGYRKVC